MQELGIRMTEDDVSNRIKATRTTSIADLRRVEKAAKSGASVDDLYQPTCSWFKDADRFLRNLVSRRPVFENIVSKINNLIYDFNFKLLAVFIALRQPSI